MSEEINPRTSVQPAEFAQTKSGSPHDNTIADAHHDQLATETQKASRPPSSETRPAKGAFRWEPDGAGKDADELRGRAEDDFNLQPLESRSMPIPDDQRTISSELYEIRNILKLLKEQHGFRKVKWEYGLPRRVDDNKTYNEFIGRIKQAANVGCVSSCVDTPLATDALKQIRADILRRIGRHVIFKYLLSLGICALIGIVIAFAAVFAADHGISFLAGYGWVLFGSMLGAWLSVAAGRREVSFDSIPDFLNYGFEPAIRMLFVGVLASVFALFLQLGLFSVTVAKLELSQFATHPSLAIAIGVVAGIGERALSVQLIARAQNILSPGKR